MIPKTPLKLIGSTPMGGPGLRPGYVAPAPPPTGEVNIRRVRATRKVRAS